MAELPSTEAKSESASPMDRLWVALFGVGLIVLGGAMNIWPKAMSGDGLRSRKLLARLVEWIWGRPGGIVVIIAGVLILAMAIMCKPTPAAPTESTEKK